MSKRLDRVDQASAGHSGTDEPEAPFDEIELMVRQPSASYHPWGWTQERRARQALAVQKWRPWQSATGPTTAEGKKRSSQNASKPNSVRRQLEALKAEIGAVLREVRRAQRAKGRSTR